MIKEYNYEFVEYSPVGSVYENKQKIDRLGKLGYKLVNIIEEKHTLVFEQEIDKSYEYGYTKERK